MKHPYEFAEASFAPFLLPEGQGWKNIFQTSLLYTVLYLIFLWLCFPIIAEFFMVAFEIENTEPSGEEIGKLLGSMGKFLGVCILFFIPYMLISCSSLAAFNRAYLFDERRSGFLLRIEPDLWRVLLASIIQGLILGGGFVIWYLVVVALIAGGSATDAGGGFVGFGFLLSLALFILIAWVGLRLTPLTSNYVKTKSLSLGQTWRMSKGYVWWAFLSFLVIYLIFYLVQQVVLYGGIFGLGFMNMDVFLGMEDLSQDEIIPYLKEQLLTSGNIIVGTLVLFFFMLTQVAMVLCFAGIGAFIAKHNGSDDELTS